MADDHANASGVAESAIDLGGGFRLIAKHGQKRGGVAGQQVLEKAFGVAGPC